MHLWNLNQTVKSQGTLTVKYIFTSLILQKWNVDHFIIINVY